MFFWSHAHILYWISLHNYILGERGTSSLRSHWIYGFDILACSRHHRAHCCWPLAECVDPIEFDARTHKLSKQLFWVKIKGSNRKIQSINEYKKHTNSDERVFRISLRFNRRNHSIRFHPFFVHSFVNNHSSICFNNFSRVVRFLFSLDFNCVCTSVRWRLPFFHSFLPTFPFVHEPFPPNNVDDSINSTIFSRLDELLIYRHFSHLFFAFSRSFYFRVFILLLSNFVVCFARWPACAWLCHTQWSFFNSFIFSFHVDMNSFDIRLFFFFFALNIFAIWK